MTCVSVMPAYQTGYHLYDLKPEILINPYQAAQVSSILSTVLTIWEDGPGMPITIHPCLRPHQDFDSCNLSTSVYCRSVITYTRAKFTLGIFPSKTNTWFCYVLIVFEIMWGIAAFVATILLCNPVQSYWLINMRLHPNTAKCIDVAALYHSTSGPNILTDCTLSHRTDSRIFADYSGSSHLPVAGERSRVRSDLGSATRDVEIHVLSWSHHLHRWCLSRVVHLHLRCIVGFSL
jgi:hypothetical protein